MEADILPVDEIENDESLGGFLGVVMATAPIGNEYWYDYWCGVR